MNLTPHVHALGADLASAASLGGGELVEAARGLVAAAEPSLHLRLLDVLTEAAVAIGAQLPDGHVEVRLAGRDAELVYVPEEETAPAPADDGLTARMTLRLPEPVKAGVEAAAARDGVSVNTWVVRALQRALEPRTQRGPGRTRLQGYAQS